MKVSGITSKLAKKLSFKKNKKSDHKKDKKNKKTKGASSESYSSPLPSVLDEVIDMDIIEEITCASSSSSDDTTTEVLSIDSRSNSSNSLVSYYESEDTLERSDSTTSLNSHKEMILVPNLSTPRIPYIDRDSIQFNEELENLQVVQSINSQHITRNLEKLSDDQLRVLQRQINDWYDGESFDPDSVRTSTSLEIITPLSEDEQLQYTDEQYIIEELILDPIHFRCSLRGDILSQLYSDMGFLSAIAKSGLSNVSCESLLRSSSIDVVVSRPYVGREENINLLPLKIDTACDELLVEDILLSPFPKCYVASNSFQFKPPEISILVISSPVEVEYDKEVITVQSDEEIIKSIVEEMFVQLVIHHEIQDVFERVISYNSQYHPEVPSNVLHNHRFEGFSVEGIVTYTPSLNKPMKQPTTMKRLTGCGTCIM
jgi:hypothetical protein